MRHLFLLVLVGAMVIGAGHGLARAENGSLRTQGLRCEYLSNPLAIEEPRPRLTWTVASDRRAERQTAYQVLVASTAAGLAADRGDLWDSGRVDSDETAHIEYAGKPLVSRQACHWKVRAWDRDGRAGAWSNPAVWEMGLLAPEDWTAKWLDAGPSPVALRVIHAGYETADGAVKKDVTAAVDRLVSERGGSFVVNNESLGGDPAYGTAKILRIRYEFEGAACEVETAENKTVELPSGRLPYLRRGFTLNKGVSRARLYATALGVYELSLNGERVGDEHLAPGWTDYRRRVRYQVFDVTSQLRKGENALGALVGPGWFCGRAGLFGITHFYGQRPGLLVQLEVTFEDGSVERIGTDEHWKRHDSPLVMADLMKGETYDATLAIEGWNTAGLDDSTWSPVTSREEHRNLEADVSEPVRGIAELPARSVNEPAPGRWVFDLGQNMVGVVRLRVAAPRGTVVTIRHGEMLNPDGTLYTANLRGAACIDTYTCDGTGSEVWQPRFTFHGFRYVELTGLPQPPAIDSVRGVVLSSAMPTAGEFECSDQRINQLQSNIVWGLRGNYLSIPTDCPQRDERMGWMADTQVFVPTATYNSDIAAFMTKWIADVIDAQRDDGAHSDVAPVTRGLTYGTPAWADAGTIVPWLIYETYGDKRVLERSIDSMIAWVEWCRGHSTGLLRDRDRGNDYGDWLSIGADTPKDVLGTAYFAHTADLVGRSLRALGRDAEAERYEQLYSQVRAAFNSTYVAADGRIKGDTQTVYILALRFGLLDDARREAALGYLLDDVRRRGDRLSTGFVGVSHLLPVLSENGEADTAYRLLMQDEFPSWLYSVKHGATTIWERWNGYTPETGPHPDIGMNSFNHYALGSCGQWLFARVGGIAAARDAPGFQHLVIEPCTTGPISEARAKYRCIRGEVSSEWKRSANGLLLRVSVPANTTATIILPAGSMDAVRESGLPVLEAEGVRSASVDAGQVQIVTGSGEYWFEVKNP